MAAVADGRGRAGRGHVGEQRGGGRADDGPAAAEAQEVGAHVVGGLVAVARVLRQRGDDDPLEVGRHVGIAFASAAPRSSRTCLYATETGDSAVNGATPVTIS